MPPKAVQKQKEKAIADKTFGLKNKNKSKKVQQYVQNVANSVQASGKSRKELQMAEARKQEREDAKKAQAAMEAEMNALFKTVIKPTVVPAGVDPKSVVCEFFKQGKCIRGAKCKYSHDIEASRKVAKIDLYSDPRKLEGDTMDSWDQNKLETVVNQKYSKRPNETQIVCKYFLEAIEKKKYGWFWECPNGPTCIYQHKLPPGYVLKVEKPKGEEEEDEGPTLEEQIEEERKRLDLSKCTPVNPDSFAKWKEVQKQKKKDAAEEKRAAEAKKTGGKGLGVLSGRDLFEFDPSLFVDDDGAAEGAEYEERVDANELDNETGEHDGADGSADEGEDEDDDNEKQNLGPINEELFLDDEALPDDE